jgi:hypothetical protein
VFSWWSQTWEERGAAVRRELGETEPPGCVTSFSWDDPGQAVPGACAMSFPPRGRRDCWLYLSLGITQPVEEGAARSDWEFCVYSRSAQSWPNRLLYELVSGWREAPDHLSRGHWLPVTFFKNARGQLDCAAATLPDSVQREGAMRGLYLWPSTMDRTLFEVNTGNFFLMCATLVTENEERLADRTSPPHLLLALKRLGIGQVSDPYRESACMMPGFEEVWTDIERLGHGDAVRQLMAK